MPRKPGQPQISFVCPPELAAKLKELSDRTMIPQSRLLRRALELLLEEYADPGRVSSGAKGRK